MKRVAWFAALLTALCFEGLGRKLLPDAPSVVFYYAKDAVLLVGLLAFGISGPGLHAAGRLFRGFGPVLGLALVWTAVETLNPAQPSLVLALIGIRAYWLWWIAPLVIASALQHEDELNGATWLLSLTAIGVVIVAALQFGASADAWINEYARFGGETLVATATVGTTGRARVSSTFAYLTGFTDFVTLVPPLLLGLAMGLGGARARLRFVAVAAAVASLAAIPFSGSRAPLGMAVISVLGILWSTGVVMTSTGRRILAGSFAAVALATAFTPDAVRGLVDRVGGDDTSSRLAQFAEWLPIVALEIHDYDLLGDGTGTQQNARIAFGVEKGRNTEGETSRMLAEQGAIGYLLVWATKLGICCRVAPRLPRAADVADSSTRGRGARVGGVLDAREHHLRPRRPSALLHRGRPAARYPIPRPLRRGAMLSMQRRVVPGDAPSRSSGSDGARRRTRGTRCAGAVRDGGGCDALHQPG